MKINSGLLRMISFYASPNNGRPDVIASIRYRVSSLDYALGVSSYFCIS